MLTIETVADPSYIVELATGVIVAVFPLILILTSSALIPFSVNNPWTADLIAVSSASLATFTEALAPTFVAKLTLSTCGFETVNITSIEPWL
ncbi:hypothetical protein [Mesoplasma melaleucae]|uniref:Uncharacterized protein n=1 Tax=Mesoplasma melaleucae TaxID=81459 RepID=A0A2K8NWC0_9MOLU|nr:hypothetical protein [Mesoplasma melaleucae]ATZ18145.1 hypothetical protein EMELA_v1c06380 [Mesoplasma melaleucae]